MTEKKMHLRARTEGPFPNEKENEKKKQTKTFIFPFFSNFVVKTFGRGNLPGRATRHEHMVHSYFYEFQATSVIDLYFCFTQQCKTSSSV